MSKHLRTDLERLEKQLLGLGALAEEAVRKATSALLDRRRELAEEVIAGDREIDHMEVEIEEESLKCLALHQPVAHDLRFIAACLKINNDLERVGDLAVNIAERAQSLSSAAPTAAPRELRAMMEAAARMLRQSLDAFVDQNAEMALRVCADDEIVDRHNRNIIQEMIARMQREPESIDLLVQYVTVSRNLERIADHATNVAEDVAYMVRGEIVRHGRGLKLAPAEKPA